MERRELLDSYLKTRRKTEEICKPLQTEDFVIQSMDDVSPPKWHLGHTTWFFETFLLGKFVDSYKPFHPLYNFIFNSYYESIGNRVARPTRGLLSRPTVKDVYSYRWQIDSRMGELIESIGEDRWRLFAFLVELGIHHEQQHEELLVMDIKNILAINPLRPSYKPADTQSVAVQTLPPSRFIELRGDIFEMGYEGSGFSFDNERPRHKVLLNDYQLQNRLVTNRDYLEFINDGGYSNFNHWLSDGWATVNQQGWYAPLYWEKNDGEWHVMTLSGLQKLDLAEPVCHVSYYEADAFARWAQKRLPTETEWERAARLVENEIPSGNFVESGRFHPAPPLSFSQNQDAPFIQMFGDVWEWTSSAYLPYPGFRPEAGAIGEYNGKFMSNQMVLRGGSCATPVNHIRTTYRNFFQCDKRWSFSGIRLAKDS